MSGFSKIKEFITISLGDVIGTAISSVFWIYLATQIEPAQYGEIHYFLGIVGVISFVVTIGTRDTIIVYVSKKIHIQSTFYFISIISAIIASSIIMLIFYRADASLLLIGYVINILAIGELLGKKFYAAYSKYVLVQKTLTLVLGLGFFFIFGYEGVLYALAASYVAFTIIIYKGFRETKIDFSLLKPRMTFILHNYSVQVIGGFAGQIDKIIIVPILGFALLGNYSLALVMVNVMLMFSHIVFKYLLPQDARGEDTQKIKLNVVFVSVGIALLGIIFLPMVIPEFFPKFTDVVGIIQLMSVGVIIKTATSVYESKFLGLEKSKFTVIATILHLIAMVIGMIIMGLSFGIVGLAYAFILANSIKLSFCIFADRILLNAK